MKRVALKKISLLLICSVFLFGNGWTQKKSDQLQAEQNKLEKKLSTTKSLLEKVKRGTQNSLSELKLIETQVRDREELVQNVDNQIRGAELTISSKAQEVKLLQKRVFSLKEQYRRLLIYAYKHRNKYGKMMYIFSSSNYFEAVKRNNYLRRVSDIQRKQFKLIKQSQTFIKTEINSIKTEKEKKEELLVLKIEEKNKMLSDKEKKQKALDKLKKDEVKLMADLKTAERQKNELKRRIKQAIEKEIAEAEAKARKEQQRQEAKANANTNNTNATTAATSSSKPAEKKLVITETKESVALSKNFESNRGRLPWPVLKGSITEGYGKNPHPTIPNVYTNNNGIDIGAPRNAQVRAVFQGEVTSVLNIPGAGKVIIIKHGNYRTVYSNLQEVYVSVGSSVGTKQSIGSLLTESDGGLSTAHFEIHQVINGTVQRINPTLWLAQ
ncbi:MAG: peptidoglycan DD-metalloendopeptidase family protein [Fluviicola sp.]|nr:peptidoglycan DD-metalloendopeptidase family protein [Fluviicola sp.]